MIAMLHATYPAHAFKTVVQAFMSPDIPKRPEGVKELSSITFHDSTGGHVIFTFDVPAELLSDFMSIQSKRTVFMATRAPGFNTAISVGEPVGSAIASHMPFAA